ncbi:alpha/beta hydrolase [Arsenicibacter rosenii]|uniref:Alpha/beta hydrolase n=1 Tax=Arsenicibacter rosenii TaxID=1750698 RepID=A0A1S2VGQ2_9BACT|nr:alpha/beta hydrolase [Arsenicibacter rosenii]OIN57068.1 alpha/beta hydrolase [Arsenicibacter rosenii]
MKRFFKRAGILMAILGIGYMAGPRFTFPDEQIRTAPVETDLAKLDRQIAASEAKADLKPDNQARIVWADSNRKVRTPYSMVYIPGFAASWAEGDPVHKQLAKTFGCNLYLGRTYEHGLKSPDAMEHMTPARYLASAEEALAIGRALGDKVIVIGTSAGGMLTLCLAAKHPDLAGIVLYSPCIAVAVPALKLVTGPWGKQIGQTVLLGNHVVVTKYTPDRAQYWLTQYHINGFLTLQTMLDTYMTPETFAMVKQPLFMGYYYKDEEHQDKVVSVAAMQEMYEALGTPAGLKRRQAFPDAGAHVIASHFTSKSLSAVYQSTKQFLEEVLHLQPVAPSATKFALARKK